MRNVCALLAAGLLVSVGVRSTETQTIDVWLKYIARIEVRTGNKVEAGLWGIRVCNNSNKYQVLDRARILGPAPFTDIPDSLANIILSKGNARTPILKRLLNMILIIVHQPMKPECECLQFGTLMPNRIVLEPQACGVSDWIVVAPVIQDPKSTHYLLEMP
jgi:hypothetical protein